MLSQNNIFIVFPRALASELALDSPFCLANLVNEFEDVFSRPPQKDYLL